MAHSAKSGLLTRLAWFFGLWLASVIGLGAVAMLIRTMILPR